MKYNGVFENWLLFWNKFEVEIDKVDLFVVMKFVYLKELVELCVKRGIDGFFFFVEGYEWVKNIFKVNYGKIFEIINVYVENILVFLIIFGMNVIKIYDFYELLLYNV